MTVILPLMTVHILRTAEERQAPPSRLGLCQATAACLVIGRVFLIHLPIIHFSLSLPLQVHLFCHCSAVEQWLMGKIAEGDFAEKTKQNKSVAVTSPQQKTRGGQAIPAPTLQAGHYLPERKAHVLSQPPAEDHYITGFSRSLA